MMILIEIFFPFFRNLGNNKLNSLEKMPFRGLTQLRDLTLADNLITYIPEDAFAGLSHLSYL